MWELTQVYTVCSVQLLHLPWRKILTPINLLKINNIKIGELEYRIVTENLSRMYKTLDLISSCTKMKIKINHTKNNEVIRNA